MNPLDKSIDDVFFSIPRKLLDICFIKYNQSVNNNYQINTACLIREQVVVPRVLVDCNLVGGVEVRIPVSKCEVLERDDYKAVLRVPKSLSQGRTIISVREVCEEQPNVGTNIGSLTGMANAMANPTPEFDFQYTSMCRVVAENTIYCENIQNNFPYLVMVCLIENDKLMSNLPPRAYHHFSKLVTLAVKAHIYNTCVINMEEGVVHGGAAYSTFKSIVDSYADANQMYQEFLTDTWTKVALMSDQTQYTDFIRGGIRVE